MAVAGNIAADLFGIIAVSCCARACCVLLLVLSVGGGAIFWSIKSVELSMPEYWGALGLSFVIMLLALFYMFGLCKGKAGSAGGFCGKGRKK